MTAYSTNNFWDQYKDYVKECFPRHFNVIKMFEFLIPTARTMPLNLLDLGCGGCKEADDLFLPFRYFGVDAFNNPKDKGILCDYRKEFHRIADEIRFAPDCFTSIFSTEVTGTALDNRILYDCLFKTFPSIKWAVVSGFYYGNQRQKEKVMEVGGLESYQSIADICEFKSQLFDETRITIPGPSKMFGKDVIEVWKLLIRK